MNEFYMVYVEGRRGPRRMHPTREIADGEALRLIPLNPGYKIHVLTVLNTIVVPGERVDDPPKVKAPVVTVKKRRKVLTETESKE